MVGYDYNQGDTELDVVYHATPDIVYRFQDVTPGQFCTMIAAPSVGAHLALLVKGKRHTKHGLPENADHDTPLAKTGPVDVVVPKHVAASRVQEQPLTASGSCTAQSDEDVFNAITNRPKKT